MLFLFFGSRPSSVEEAFRPPEPSPCEPPSPHNLVVPREGSDIFPFLQRTLTVDKGAFNTSGVAADYGIRLTPRLEAVVGVDANRRRRRHCLVSTEADRRFVDALDPRMPVCPHEFSASGVSPSAHVFSGVDVRLHGRWYATLDARCLWAAA